MNQDEVEDQMRHRVEHILESGQFGCAGQHHGRRGDPDCPPHRHHHHDLFCGYPTTFECAVAGVPWRAPRLWGSRA
jgi:hypothetical protein